MQRWTRLPRAIVCGRCGTHVPAGGAILEITIAAVRTPHYRCPLCEPAPPDLPPLVELVRVAGSGEAPRDPAPLARALLWTREA